jgi:hypothetical protein
LQGKHTKDSPLVPSGLLGPVTLQPATPPQVFAAEAVQSSLADDGRYNELFLALTALKDHITGKTALDTSQINIAFEAPTNSNHDYLVKCKDFSDQHIKVFLATPFYLLLALLLTVSVITGSYFTYLSSQARALLE